MPKDSILGLNKIKSHISSRLAQNKLESSIPMIPLDHIEEDGKNPRGSIDMRDPENIEFANHMRIRGFTSVISLRPNPEKPGFYLINYGHRRVAIAKEIATIKEVPALITEDFREVDRLSENMQRQNLTVAQITKYISYLQESGMSLQQIADEMGKSIQTLYIYMRVAKASPEIREAINNGKLNDLTLIAKLMSTEKKTPKKVHAIIKRSKSLTRSDLENIDKEIKKDVPEQEANLDNNISEADFFISSKETEAQQENILIPETMKIFGHIFAEHKKGIVLLLTDRPAKSPKHIWVQFVEPHGQREVRLSSLKILSYHYNNIKE